MILIIDSNNLLGHPASRITHSMKRELSTRLARYASYTQHTLILVFDGGKEYERIEATTQLSIIHAGPNQTADTVIESLIKKFQNDQIVVITKDRTIRSYAAKASVITISPVQFLERVAAREAGSVSKKSSSKKPSIRQYNSPDAPTDELMLRAALMHELPEKTESHLPTRERPSYTESTQERILLSILEKL